MTEDTGHQQSAVEQPAEVEPFDMVEVIHTKRDGHALADEQIDWVIDAYTRGVVAEEQMSALAMAIFLRGMGRREISRRAISGRSIDRKSTRLNSSHVARSYAVFCLKKKIVKL